MKIDGLTYVIIRTESAGVFAGYGSGYGSGDGHGYGYGDQNI